MMFFVIILLVVLAAAMLVGYRCMVYNDNNVGVVDGLSFGETSFRTCTVYPDWGHLFTAVADFDETERDDYLKLYDRRPLVHVKWIGKIPVAHLITPDEAARLRTNRSWRKPAQPQKQVALGN